MHLCPCLLAPRVPGSTPWSGVPQPAKNKLTGAHTPLRHSQFERELANHPDKAWVSRLLTGIDMGIDIGYIRGHVVHRTLQPFLCLSTSQHHSIRTAKGTGCWESAGPILCSTNAIPSLFRPQSGAQERQQVAHDPALICTPPTTASTTSSPKKIFLYSTHHLMTPCA